MDKTNNLNISFASVTDQGQRPYQEDSFICFTDVAIPSGIPFAVLSINDGHADDKKISQFSCEYFREHVKHLDIFTMSYSDEHITAKITDLFTLLDTEIYTRFVAAPGLVRRVSGGSTILLCIYFNGKIVTGNLGDSEAGLISKKLCSKTGQVKYVFNRLSYAHKPNKQDERDRIVSTVRETIFDGTKKIDLYNSVHMGRVNGSLAVSRAVGDFSYKVGYKTADHSQNAVSFYPYVSVFRLNPIKDYILILGSDGLWDILNTINENNLKNMLGNYTEMYPNEPYKMANELLQYALKNGSSDNITVTVAYIKL